MATDDPFKKAAEAGADFLETARVRAEEFLRELANLSGDWTKAGDATQKRAQAAVDDLVENSRRNTEQLINSIRKEVAAQLSLMGVVTRRELAALEARLTGRKPAEKAPAAKKAPPAKTPPATKKAPVAKKATTAAKTSVTKASAKKASAKKASAAKTSAKKAPAKKAAG